MQGAYEDNAVWHTHPETYYFSYITEQTTQALLSKRYFPDLRMNPAMLATSTYIGGKEFKHPPIPVPDFNSSDWWENDGLVPTYSQQYPHISGDHPVGDEFDTHTPVAHFQKGRWYYQWERNVDHLDVCITPQLTQIGWQKRFYKNLFERLADL